uniref:ATP-binding protein-homolog n=1 Tax=Thermoactinomyces vulgaris TaxID=2026 RepID=Q9AJF6_THEVU|nr:ATP-binding protein-homolog [Thermoactinomyces vulgaris]
MIIEMNSVSWMREGKMILKNISWQVQPGENWCLIGLNGSGKTTLLNLVNGYIWPTTGTVKLFGKKFGEVNLRELRKKIGWVSSSLAQQLHNHETAINIVLSGKFASIGLYDKPEKIDMEKAAALLEMMGCGHLITQTYQTLSQGEKQKVLIARALMASPQLMILDEPCTGLDLFAREQLLHSIQSISAHPQSPALIYVTHHVEEITNCFTHTLLLKQGEIFRAGPTSHVLTEELLSDFFDTPIEVEHRGKRCWIRPLEPSRPLSIQ